MLQVTCFYRPWRNAVLRSVAWIFTGESPLFILLDPWEEALPTPLCLLGPSYLVQLIQE